jgi:hypothetical protein
MKTTTLNSVINKSPELFNNISDVVVSPKLFNLVEVDEFTASILNLRWHSRLPNIPPSNIIRNPMKVCYCARFNNINYAVAIWTSPVARALNNQNILELRRLAISQYAPKNTASWMISKMIKLISDKFPSVDRLISYQDLEVHTGTIYKASNWIPTIITKVTPWNRTRKDRHNLQSTANKMRWEYEIKHKRRELKCQKSKQCSQESVT